MEKKNFKIYGMVLAAVFLLALSSCGKGKVFEIQSAAFKNDERVPDKYYHGNAAGRENISLPFKWKNPPDGTKSFALILYNEHHSRTHWAVFNIPATCSEIAENASGKNMPVGSIELPNYFRTAGYGGLEPPAQKTMTHAYVAVIYALNTETITLPDTGIYKAFVDLKSILDGKIIAKAEIHCIASLE